ncbi:MAG: UDP-N-acetylmuramate dehydrogenase, partial [Alphaproteobacteria bacterium]
MTAAAAIPVTRTLMERLPAVRGTLMAEALLAGSTWFGVGGPAEALFRPADRDDLCAFLAATPTDIPLTVIGAASNLLIRDGGISGVVIRLGREFANLAISGEAIVCEAGAQDLAVAQAARTAGLGGLEFLSGIPGSIGGALRMNAGAYGREMKDVLVSAEAVDRSGTLHVLAPEDMGLAYRHCSVPGDWVFTRATLRGTPTDTTVIDTRMREIRTARAESQPLGSRTGGSTFANPDGARAWELIDRAGCRGLRRGGAMISEKHC